MFIIRNSSTFCHALARDKIAEIVAFENYSTVRRQNKDFLKTTGKNQVLTKALINETYK